MKLKPRMWFAYILWSWGLWVMPPKEREVARRMLRQAAEAVGRASLCGEGEKK